MKAWTRTNAPWIEYLHESGIRIIKDASRPFYNAYHPDGGYIWYVGRNKKQAMEKAIETWGKNEHSN